MASKSAQLIPRTWLLLCASCASAPAPQETSEAEAMGAVPVDNAETLASACGGLGGQWSQKFRAGYCVLSGPPDAAECNAMNQAWVRDVGCVISTREVCEEHGFTWTVGDEDSMITRQRGSCDAYSKARADCKSIGLHAELTKERFRCTTTPPGLPRYNPVD